MRLAHTRAMEDAERAAVRSAAFGRQAQALRSSLASYFRLRVHDPPEIDDLVQEVFLRAAGHVDVEDQAHLTAYLFRTAASVLADRHRRRAARRAGAHVPFVDELHGDEAPDPARIADGRAMLRSAAAAMMSLPERTRAVFVLRRLEGMKVREIAQRLGISVSAVEKHMIRAIEHLMIQTRDLR